ncbi:probable LRR receptor-like serine/threonine-protein kinase At1g05700 [Rutidosis leptorrhynchoides]|uniref:probable LRR receptor-like serine/threonine-protein kinase At1g05700 n=1 Tax=Rutidosis leptorrhynchoides TaxID=125765 RepID=UPI003A9956FB
MKTWKVYFTKMVLVTLVLTPLIQAQDDQSGFISIDCGLANGSAYTDNLTGINYVSDANLIDSGDTHNVLPIYSSPVYTYLNTLRSFPQNIRNCYTLTPIQGKGNRYLIRALFMYGNYDFINRIPKFDVYLGPNYWDTIALPSEDTKGYIEIIHVSSSDYIHVCLVNTGDGTPFISSIELRLLASDMYTKTDFGSLKHFVRENRGARDGEAEVRYHADKYDRIWKPIFYNDGNILSTTNEVSTVSSGDPYPPSEVMSTGITPKNRNDSYNIYWTPRNATDLFVIFLHFSELEILKRNQTRRFNIYLNEYLWYENLSPEYLNRTTISSGSPQNAAPKYKITLTKTSDSTLPPIINALELYTIKILPQRQTDDRDVAAIWAIKSKYGVSKKWQGDPCVPREFVWDGIGCSYNDGESPRIILLNLSSSGLNGEIDPKIEDLAMITTLDLSNNNLTGRVPNLLLRLNLLKFLYIKGNKFTGPIPAEMLSEGSLFLSFDDGSAGGTTSYCNPNRCKNNKANKIIAPVVIATAALVFVILIALVIIWVSKRYKGRGKWRRYMELKVRKLQYTYTEIQKITNNFRVVIGRGGFGTVYHGYIGDTEVAVKMLSETSLQGDKEFQAEANLLSKVHHKNLTLFIGYCNEGNHKGIIYEYMVNGDLEKHLFDTSSSNLDWEKRLQIGCDAARGLEYLHHGCKPPTIHRDIKCTNILLDGTFQAKLADFGLSRAFKTECTHISTEVAGTPGYCDPEYFTSKQLTEKSDVYSFGVVLLVIVTGQPAIMKYDNDQIHISRWVHLKLTNGDVKNIVDPRLLDNFDINSAWKAVELAMSCVVDTPYERPTMNQVVMRLNDCLVTERARQEMEPRNYVATLMAPNLESLYDPNPR